MENEKITKTNTTENIIEDIKSISPILIGFKNNYRTGVTFDRELLKNFIEDEDIQTELLERYNSLKSNYNNIINENIDIILSDEEFSNYCEERGFFVIECFAVYKSLINDLFSGSLVDLVQFEYAEKYCPNSLKYLLHEMVSEIKSFFDDVTDYEMFKKYYYELIFNLMGSSKLSILYNIMKNHIPYDEKDEVQHKAFKRIGLIMALLSNNPIVNKIVNLVNTILEDGSLIDIKGNSSYSSLFVLALNGNDETSMFVKSNDIGLYIEYLPESKKFLAGIPKNLIRILDNVGLDSSGAIVKWNKEINMRRELSQLLYFESIEDLFIYSFYMVNCILVTNRNIFDSLYESFQEVCKQEDLKKDLQDKGMYSILEEFFSYDFPEIPEERVKFSCEIGKYIIDMINNL